MKRFILSVLLIGPQLTNGFVSLNRHQAPTASFPTMLQAMPELPSDVEKYTQLPSLESYFTNEFIPQGLLKDHTTKDGTWGVIRLNQGKLQYNVGGESFELSPSEPGIIEPNVKHSVKSLSEDLEFVVEFHRVPVD